MAEYDMRTANALSHACTRCLYATQRKVCQKNVRATRSGCTVPSPCVMLSLWNNTISIDRGVNSSSEILISGKNYAAQVLHLLVVLVLLECWDQSVRLELAIFKNYDGVAAALWESQLAVMVCSTTNFFEVDPVSTIILCLMFRIWILWIRRWEETSLSAWCFCHCSKNWCWR